jgi:hypothetical protein
MQQIRVGLDLGLNVEGRDREQYSTNVGRPRKFDGKGRAAVRKLGKILIRAVPDIEANLEASQT